MKGHPRQRLAPAHCALQAGGMLRLMLRSAPSPGTFPVRRDVKIEACTAAKIRRVLRCHAADRAAHRLKADIVWPDGLLSM
jgi:hypothetical protein